MDVPERESHWTESIASGSRSFIIPFSCLFSIPWLGTTPVLSY
jgi:hypothetical protein